MASVLVFVAVVAVCLAMLWASYRMEPHWVSKDGDRMICFGQGLSRHGQSSGRWRELRVSKVRDDTVEVRPRRGSLAVDSAPGSPPTLASSIGRRRGGRRATYWKVVGQTSSAGRNRVTYLLNGSNDPDMPELLAIRLPAKSKAIAMLESMAVNRSTAPSKPSRGTTQSVDRPDPD